MKYRKLHPTKEGKRKWRFVVTGIIDLPLYGAAKSHPPCLLFANGKKVAQISNGWLNVYPGYAWNGCSPKFYIGWPPVGKWVGTPDFDGTILPSLGHDILFQFSVLLRLSMQSANTQFFLWMDDNGLSEELRDIYHGAVAQWGDKYWGKDDPTLTVTYV